VGHLNDFDINFQLSLTVKEFLKSVNIWRSYGQEFAVLFVVDRPLRFSYLSRLAASGALAEFRCGHLTD